MANAPMTARARARAELVEEIKAAGRRQLREVGASELSLRAVARELGMVSSAVYRYFASRDELLTALLVDAYDALGAAAEEAAADRRGGFEARWVRVATAIRAWAVAHPHEYALLYGSPVPGYHAPGDTVPAAARPPIAALGVVADAVAAGEVDESRTVPIPRALRADLARLRADVPGDLPDEVLVRCLYAWTQIFGGLGFELFGHLHNVVEAYDDLFTHQARRAARLVLQGS
ncbi:MAG TPA: TetR/AcrR family transcriptional regulator [Iamia sp.]|nr:TetR/AcrR family transcriptional regulator [Iamia sp.]